MAIFTIFILLFFLSIPVLIVGLIRPSLFKFLPKKIQTRGKLSLLILLTGFLCFVLAIATAPAQKISDSSNNEAVADTTPKNEEESQSSTVATEPTQEVTEPQEESKNEVVEGVNPQNDQEGDSSTTATDAQKELDEIMELAKTAGLVTSYEFSDSATVVYASSTWYTQTVQFKKDFLAKIAILKKQITGYQHFEVLDAYSNEKVGEVTAFFGSLEIYK